MSDVPESKAGKVTKGVSCFVQVWFVQVWFVQVWFVQV
jgi:hypothetical protein